MDFVKHTGGREKYFRGEAGDCVTRSIAIALNKDYKEVYDVLYELNKDYRKRVHKKNKKHYDSPRNGVMKKVYEKYLADNGWTWVSTMGIGTGCKVHLRENELPNGRLIVRVSKHITCVIDGTLYDTYDCTRGGARCVYGYWYKREADPKFKPCVTILKESE